MDIWNLETTTTLKSAPQARGVFRETAPKVRGICEKTALKAGNDDREKEAKQQPLALPSIKNGSELIIPSDCDPKYKWWAGGQSIFDTLLELDAPDSVIEHYIGRIESPADWRRWQGIMEERIAARAVGGQQGVF